MVSPLPHDSSPAHERLLGEGDPAPAIVRRSGAGASFLLICDHAGRETPRRLGDMGVSQADWERHIAWDIGAAALTESLSQALDAPAVLQRYSRLVIDCNRDPQRADATPAVADGVPIPANAALSSAERARRIGEIHEPYHAAIAAELLHPAASERPRVLVCVHSFTPRLSHHTADRPWTYGVLHHGGSPASQAMLAALRAELGEAVGDNEPYAFDDIDYSAPRHAIARGLDYVELEVRQDLLQTDLQVAMASDLLAGCLKTVLAAARP